MTAPVLSLPRGSLPRGSLPPVTAELTLPQGACRGVFYLHTARPLALPALPDVAVCCLFGLDWARDLSPWPAPRAFRGDADFGGGAAEYQAFLLGQVLPAVEAQLGLPPGAPRGIGGYSLGGLFAVYCAYTCDKFNALASMSGSLWYDGFARWAEQRTPPRVPCRAWFSLGKAEAATKGRTATVGAATQAQAQRFAALGAQTRLVWREGGHFHDVADRCAQGLAWAAGGLASPQQNG